MALQAGGFMDYLPIMPVSGPVISISFDVASNTRFAGKLEQTPVSNKLLLPGCKHQRTIFFFYSGI